MTGQPQWLGLSFDFCKLVIGLKAMLHFQARSLKKCILAVVACLLFRLKTIFSLQASSLCCGSLYHRTFPQKLLKIDSEENCTKWPEKTDNKHGGKCGLSTMCTMCGLSTSCISRIRNSTEERKQRWQKNWCQTCVTGKQICPQSFIGRQNSKNWSGELCAFLKIWIFAKNNWPDLCFETSAGEPWWAEKASYFFSSSSKLISRFLIWAFGLKLD